MSSPFDHNYMKRLLGMGEALPHDGGTHVVTVMHDDWCDFWKGKRCNCSPDFRIKQVAPAEVRRN